MFCFGFVTASVNENIPVIQPTIVPSNFNVSNDSENEINIQNVTDFLHYWNERLVWGLSQEQIHDYSTKVENKLLKNLTITDGRQFHVNNLTQFNEELGSIIGLNDTQISAFIIESRKQLVIDHLNYHKTYHLPEKAELLSSASSVSSVSSVSAGSQSAPYARGKLFYFYIFTDFTFPSWYGNWTQAEIDDAGYDAGVGTGEILQNSPPPGANVINDGLQAHIIVSGHNLGPTDVSTWGPNGWMERAAQQFGYGNTSPYQRYTENLAYRLKQDRNADSVILCFFTHDDRGSTAIGPDQGYADKVLVSYFGPTFNSEPGSYEHEMIHAYGALDENNQGNGVGCNYWPSGLAVSPMYEMYKNTNYVTCPLSTKQGVMYYPYNSPSTPFWWQISGASRKWIGWGDYDNDGILDPLDARPWGEQSKIAVFRPSTHMFYIDYNGNSAWDGELQDKMVSFGSVGDIPVKGDWNSNSLDEIGVFRSPGVWNLDFNGNYLWDGPVTDRQFAFGATGDQPVVGDWSRDGITKIGVFRTPGVWILDYNGNGNWDGAPPDTIYGFGAIGDVPVVGDWNRDGHKEIGLFRSPGVWILDYNGNNAWDGTPPDQIVGFGAVGDIPVIGDWNGDSLDEIGLYRDGVWLLDYNANNAWDGPIIDRILTYNPTGGSIPVAGNWN